MAEQIIVDGYTRNALDSLPDWAQEETQKGLLKAAAAHGKHFDAMVKLLGVTAKGQKISQNKYNTLIKEMSNTKIAVDKSNKDNKKASDEQKRRDDTQAKREMSMSSLLTNMVGHISGLRSDMEDYEKSRNKSNSEFLDALKNAGVSEDTQNLVGEGLSKLTKLGGKLNVASAALGGAIAAIGAAEAGIQMMFSAIDERFDLAVELRQRGVFAAFDGVKENLQSFSTEVSNNTFSLEQAAEMARNFGDAVGVYGMNNAMEFTKALRDEGQYIEKYGTNFNQLINITGEFLDTQKTLLSLRDLDDNRRLDSMDSFMQNITLTSNVLKVGMEEAASIIKDTLKDDDLTALLNTVMAGASSDQRTSIAAMQAAMGNTEIAKAVSMLAIDPQAFFMSSEYANLSGDVAFQQALPIFQDMANQFRDSGFDADAIGNILSGNTDRLNAVLQDDTVAALTIMGDVRSTVATISRLVQGQMDAAGNEGSLVVDPIDGAVAQNAEAVRVQGLLLEQSLTRVVSKIDDIPTLMGEHATAVANLNAEIQRSIEGISPLAAEIASGMIGIRTGVLDFSAGALATVNDTLGLDKASGTYAPGEIMDVAANKQLMAARSFERSVRATLTGEYSGEFDPEQATAMARALAQNAGSLTTPMSAEERQREIERIAVAASPYSGGHAGRGLQTQLSRDLGREATPEELHDAILAKVSERNLTGAENNLNRRLEDQAAVQNELINDLSSLILLNTEDRSAMGPEALGEFLRDEKVLNNNVTPEMLAETLSMVISSGRETGILTSESRIAYLVEQLYGETGESSLTGMTGRNSSAKNQERARNGLLNETAAASALLETNNPQLQRQNDLLSGILTEMARVRANTDGMK